MNIYISLPEVCPECQRKTLSGDEKGNISCVREGCKYTTKIKPDKTYSEFFRTQTEKVMDGLLKTIKK